MEKEVDYKGYTIKVEQDDNATNPIKDWDMFGVFTCFHRNYDLCCKRNQFKNQDEFLEFLKKENPVRLPLYLYDHSGITISTGDFMDRWDSGQVGYIWVTKQDIKNEFGCKRITKKILEKVYSLLRNDVENFDKYLTGDVYQYTIEDAEGNVVDSCGGYFPTKRYGTDEVVEECKSNIDAWELADFKKYGKQAEIEFVD